MAKTPKKKSKSTSIGSSLNAAKSAKKAQRSAAEKLMPGAGKAMTPLPKEQRVADPNMTALGKHATSFQGPTASQKVIAGMTESGKKAGRKTYGEGVGPSSKLLGKMNKRLEHKEYAKYQSAQPKTEAPAFGPRSNGQTSGGAGAFGHKPGVHADPYTAKMSTAAKSFTGPTASHKVIAGMSEAGRQAKDKKQKKMAAFGKNVAEKVKATSVAAKERHDQKPGLNPMDYKGASMSKHLRHAFSDKGPIGKAVNKITGKYDRGFEKVVAPVERGIKSAAKGTVKGVKAAGRGVKAVGKALVSPTAQGIGQAALTHAGMAIMHGSNYPQKMHELSQQGPRTFRPGWHGFTAPEKTHDTDATDTRGERS